MAANIAFVGTGRMGGNMARRLKDCGHTIAAVYDIHGPEDSTIAWHLGAAAGLQLPLAAATRLQYERMVALGLGGLDKSGVAELTFKERQL